jgi:uncharacterized phiE125 gp8 family phage protein
VQWRVTTAPLSEPITLAVAKAHLRVDFDDDDTLIGALITAAREYCEDVLGRALMTRTLEGALDDEPEGDTITLPRPPLSSVRSVKFYDTDDVATTVDPADYLVDITSEPGRVVLNDGAEWPQVDLRPANAVVIEFDAGYGDDPEDVPAKFRQAMLLMIGHWYTHREEVSVGSGSAMPIPFAASALLQVDRVMPA